MAVGLPVRCQSVAFRIMTAKTPAVLRYGSAIHPAARPRGSSHPIGLLIDRRPAPGAGGAHAPELARRACLGLSTVGELIGPSCQLADGGRQVISAAAHAPGLWHELQEDKSRSRQAAESKKTAFSPARFFSGFIECCRLRSVGLGSLVKAARADAKGRTARLASSMAIACLFISICLVSLMGKCMACRGGLPFFSSVPQGHKGEVDSDQTGG